MLVFGKYWFKKHQRILLFLLNAPVIKFWFRWIMRIRRHDLPLSVKIFRIEPNAFTWETGEPNEYSTDFRTHDKFAKRLYYAFKYVWYALHFIDWLFQPFPKLKLNFGFDTLTAYPEAGTGTYTHDAYLQVSYMNESWAAIRAEAGSVNSNSSTSFYCAKITNSATSGNFKDLFRSQILFNTSSLTSSATNVSGIFSIYGAATGNSLGLTNAEKSIAVVSSNPASNVQVSGGDFGNIGSTRFATDIDLATSQYNDFTLNSNGNNAISLTGITKFGTRYAIDLDNGTPPWIGSNKTSYVQIYYADYTGTFRDPKLVVTYTPSSSANLIKKACGLAYASLKKENGLAEASIKKADGLNNV